LITGGPRKKAQGIEPGMSIHEMEKQLILATLETEGGNQTRAADKLGISSRTLRNKLHEYGLRGPGTKSDVEGEAEESPASTPAEN
ncbi:MAG: helix-turn-helix domain-containing protein, partial [Candidatus Zixiibacteriota bacterium]